VSLKTIQELFEKGRALLERFPDSALETRLFLCKAARLDEADFYAHRDSFLTQEQEQIFFHLIDQRKSGIPLAYLTNVREFWSIPFDVCPGVLIPRPETELIVEKVIELAPNDAQVIVDIGTGSGNVAIAMAKELPKARVVATDVSCNAIRVAKSNADRMNISNINIVQGNLFAPLERLNLRNACDFIVSNPPYVSKEDWKTLPLEIRKHEPKRALVSGETGLEFIKELVKEASKFLKPGGYLVFEIGWGQRRRVLQIFGKEWSRVRSYKDLNGIPRVIVARKRLR
jgi:release factor glutamine methyltransferase